MQVDFQLTNALRLSVGLAAMTRQIKGKRVKFRSHAAKIPSMDPLLFPYPFKRVSTESMKLSASSRVNSA
jgi:hypothetical protein